MKNFFVIIICVLILSIFIAFNYVMWDRQSLQDLNETKNASIETLSREIKSLNDSNNKITKSYDEVNKKLVELENEFEIISEENRKLKEDLKIREESLTFFQTMINPNIFADYIIDWANKLSKGQYAESYILFSKNAIIFDEKINVKEYSNIFSNIIENIEINEIKDSKQNDSIENISQLSDNLVKMIKLGVTSNIEDTKPNELDITYLEKNSSYNEIAYKVGLNIFYKKNIINNYYQEGLNYFEFHFVYEPRSQIWLISKIDNYNEQK